MKAAIMQPYFFPYVGYFSLIGCTDVFIVFDEGQYARRSWMNRNRICHPARCDFSYITLDVKKATHNEKIKNIEAFDIDSTFRRILTQLEVAYRKKAPYYDETMILIERIFNTRESNLSRLNVEGIHKICQHIGLEFNYMFYSDLDLTVGNVSAPDEWAVVICKAMGYDQYVNPIGGLDFYDTNKYIDAGVEIKFVKNNLVVYEQKKKNFIPWLSIIDVLMFNGRLETLRIINEYELVGP